MPTPAGFAHAAALAVAQGRSSGGRFARCGALALRRRGLRCHGVAGRGAVPAGAYPGVHVAGGLAVRGSRRGSSRRVSSLSRGCDGRQFRERESVSDGTPRLRGWRGVRARASSRRRRIPCTRHRGGYPFVPLRARSWRSPRWPLPLRGAPDGVAVPPIYTGTDYAIGVRIEKVGRNDGIDHVGRFTFRTTLPPRGRLCRSQWCFLELLGTTGSAPGQLHLFRHADVLESRLHGARHPGDRRLRPAPRTGKPVRHDRERTGSAAAGAVLHGIAVDERLRECRHGVRHLAAAHHRPGRSRCGPGRRTKRASRTRSSSTSTISGSGRPIRLSYWTSGCPCAVDAITTHFPGALQWVDGIFCDGTRPFVRPCIIFCARRDSIRGALRHRVPPFF